MAKRLALAALFLSTLSIAGAFALAFLPGGAPPWAPWVLAIAIPVSMVGTMALGAAGRRGIGRLAYAFAVIFVLLAGGFGAILLLPATDPSDPTLWLGLPPRAALLLYGIGLVPLFIVPVAYALTFDQATLREEDLERVLEAARAASSSSPAGAPHAHASTRSSPGAAPFASPRDGPETGTGPHGNHPDGGSDGEDGRKQ